MRVTSTFLVLVLCPVLDAQQSEHRAGVLAGMSRAHVSGASLANISSRTGATFGAYYLAPLSYGWGLQLGATLGMKGWERIEPRTNDRAAVNIDYVEAPILARFDFDPADHTSFFAFGGPALGFRARCGLTVTGGTSTLSESCAEIDRASPGVANFRSYDLGAVLGTGLRFGRAESRLAITAQYEHGFTSIQPGTDIKNRVFTIGLAIERAVKK
jgi:hypothetical protein